MIDKAKMGSTYHSMTRRAIAHDYTRAGLYHITLHVAEGMGRPFGEVTGDPRPPRAVPTHRV